MATKAVIEDMIDKMEAQIQATEESLVGNRGPWQDAVKVILPMQKEQLKILRVIAESFPEGQQ